MLSKVLTLFKGRLLTIVKMAENRRIERGEAEGRIDRWAHIGSHDEVRDDAAVPHKCKGCGGCGNNGSSFRLTNKGDKVA